MGCGASAPAVHNDQPAANGHANGPAAAGAPVPDEGLTDTHVAVRHLGSGGSGQTWLYKEKATGKEVAIKLVKRPIPKVISPNILREIKIQAQLGEGHINVIDAYECLVTERHLCLVLEYAAGGSLTSYVADKWKVSQNTGLFLSEKEARYFFKQFIGAVEYCHAHNVAHRDLKLDNTLLDSSEPAILKLCDFGFAKEWETGNANMFTHIGTPVYMSPELINSRGGAKGYDGKSVDVWAAGVLLLVMLLGQFPFDHLEHPDPNSSEAHHEVWLQQVRTPWEQLPHLAGVLEKLTPECKELLDRIFVVDSSQRITTGEIKEMPWYKGAMDPKHEAALEKIHQVQVDNAARAEKRHLSQHLVAKRNEELDQAVDTCMSRPAQGAAPKTSPLIRINLRDQAVENGVAAEAGPSGTGGADAADAVPPKTILE